MKSSNTHETATIAGNEQAQMWVPDEMQDTQVPSERQMRALSEVRDAQMLGETQDAQVSDEVQDTQALDETQTARIPHALGERQRAQAVQRFRRHLVHEELSANTVRAYCATVEYFLRNYGDISKDSLLAYKGYLVENYMPQTVNQRIQALNKYAGYLGRGVRLKVVRIPRKTFLENVISLADYRFLKRRLKRDGRMQDYFIVWFLGATGARVSELLRMKVEHVFEGHVDLYSKGGKLRRIYIPSRLRKAALVWLEERGARGGYLFLNQNGQQLTASGVEQMLKKCAERYDLDPKVMYPHSFRHMFGKEFIDKHSDISLLADLMGHESIETTRIYLRKTASEQQAVVDRVITW